MTAVAIPVLSPTQPGQILDTNPTPNTGVLRDNTGGSTSSTVTATTALVIEGMFVGSYASYTSGGLVVYLTSFGNPNGGTFTMTLPAVGTSPGVHYEMIHTGTINNLITVPSDSAKINGGTAKTLTSLQSCVFISDGANWWAKD